MSLPQAEFPRHRWGATEAAWQHFQDIGLTHDLVPVVADPDATISQKSSLQGIGKTPSVFNSSREVIGFQGWSKHTATDLEIERWAADPDLGLCVVTRRMRAIDVDVVDEKQAQAVRACIEGFLFAEEHDVQEPARRTRGNSHKFLMPIWLDGAYSKRIIRTAHGLIEFLAEGQQFVAVSTHPSGERYEWSVLPATDTTPRLTTDQMERLWAMLQQRFGIADRPRAANVGRPDEQPDGLDRAIALGQVSDDTIADVRAAVDALAVEADSYDTWMRGGHALKSLEHAGRADEALDLWHRFSALSPKYDFDEADEKWLTFSPDRITYRTLFEMAQARGWINPRSVEARKADASASTRIDRTDAGNATLLADITKGDLRFVPQRRAWILWRDNRWTVDDHGVAAQAAALQVAEHYHQQAAGLRRQSKADTFDDKERKRLEQTAESLEKWASQCRNKRAIDAMLALAKGDSRFALGVDQLDRDPWLFGVDNGVVDLRTGQLRAAAREDYVTRRSPIAFDPLAKAPRWTQFIEEVTGTPDGSGGSKPRSSLAGYMQRMVGYNMTGTVEQHKMFMAVGDGANGKNVLLDTLQVLMGDYCVTVPPEALMAARGDADAERPSPVAATLAGARLAISSESRDGQRLDVALVKRHTGGGFMNARFMRENSFRFEITHKLVLMTNHRPALDHLDDAMRGRLHLIPFDMAWNRPGHPDRDPTRPDGDKDLLQKLRAEAQGILAWAVAGAGAYCRDGLEPPQEVVRMTRAFFADQDPLGRWLETMRRCEPRQGTAASELLDAFHRWRDEEGEMGGPENLQGFGRALQQRGIARVVTAGPKLYGLVTVDPEGVR